MTIKREGLDRRAVDFSDVATERLMPLVHPSEILRDKATAAGAQRVSAGPSAQGFAAAAKRNRAGTSRRYHRYRASPWALLWHDAGVLDQSSGMTRSGCRRADVALGDRAGDRALRHACRSRLLRPRRSGMNRVDKPGANDGLTGPRTLPIQGLKEWRRGWQPIRGFPG